MGHQQQHWRVKNETKDRHVQKKKYESTTKKERGDSKVSRAWKDLEDEDKVVARR
jgi:hypothetical protein